MPDRIQRVHTPAHLQGFAIGYTPRGLIADRICPRFGVTKQSDKYRVWGKQGFIRRDTRWTPGTRPSEFRMDFSDDTYFAHDYKARVPLLDKELRQADADLKLQIRYTEFGTNNMLVDREFRVATLYRNAANYAGTHVITKAGGAEWDTDPTQVIDDFETVIQAIVDDASIARNMLSVFIPERVFNKTIRHNAAFLERIKYSQKGIITEDLVQSVLGVKEVMTAAGQMKNSPENAGVAPEDIATTEIWGDDVWVGLVEPTDTDLAPTFARTFHDTSETAGQNRQVRQYRMEDEGMEGDWIEVKESVDEKITAAAAGALIVNTLA